MNNLALVYEEQGNYEKAEPLYRQALTLTENAFGPNDLHTATVAESVANVLRKLGRNFEAKLYEEKVAQIRTKVFHQ